MEFAHAFALERLHLFDCNCGGDQATSVGIFIETVEAAVRGGATMVQLREKDTPPEEVIRLGRDLLAVTRRYGALLIINDHPSVAKAVGGMTDGNAPKGVRNSIKQLLGVKAGLAYVYALNDRMIISVNSEDGPVGLSPSDLLGLPGTPGLGHIIGEIAH